MRYQSTELRNPPPSSECRTEKALDQRKLAVRFDPPLAGYYFGRQQDIDRAVLAPRYEGQSLVPEINEWPCVVNLCLPVPGADFETGPWVIIDIGELTCD